MKAELKLSAEPGPTPLAQGEPIVEFENVSKSYGTRQVLAGVSLKILKGEVLCVLGPSGTGKSVTLRHINGLEHPDKGDVRVFGQSV
ncbi:MAG TPA: ATP-binding cassette domain-containing protein, partial [Thermoanaerobaculia bacterium]|nr:ATP-binding cassette domain-containing protein [Thermoanaerobaculia bacterium]